MTIIVTWLKNCGMVRLELHRQEHLVLDDVLDDGNVVDGSG